jgi:subtilisin family serine protease
MDEGHPTTDDTSPDFPANALYHRTVTNACLDLPTEGHDVMSISAIGPSKRKADYSNYGLEQITVAAPGGFFRDDPLWKASDPPAVRNVVAIPNQILAAYPKNVGEAEGTLNPDGTPNTPSVVRDCNSKGTCAYYQWIQGTSMASPHAVGVAALIIAEYGKTRHGRFGMDPAKVEQILRRTATDTPCPEPRLHSYADKLRDSSFDALCEGTTELNGFYGDGIVDALRAVEGRKHEDGDKHERRGKHEKHKKH